MAQQTYVLNGAKTFFFPFSITQASQVALQVMPSGTVVPVADYTVEGAAPGSIAVNVTWPDAPVDGTQTLVISRELDPLRQTAFTDDAAVPARALNLEFDHIYGILEDFIAQAGLAIVGGSNITVDDTNPLAPIINLDNIQTFSSFTLNTTNTGGPLNRIMGGGNGVLSWTWDGTDTSIALQYLSNDVIEVGRIGASIPSINIYSPDPGTVSTTVNMHDTLGNLAAVWDATSTGPSSSLRSVGDHFLALGAEAPGPEIVFNTPAVGNDTVELRVHTGTSIESVLHADWDGTNSSISLQHNGGDVLVVDENGTTITTTDGVNGTPLRIKRAGTSTVVGTIETTDLDDLVIKTTSVRDIILDSASGISIGSGTNPDNISIGGATAFPGEIRIGPAQTGATINQLNLGSNVSDLSIDIGGIQSNQQIRTINIGAVGNTVNTSMQINIAPDMIANTTLSFFGAAPVARPVLTEGTTSELIATLGSTSGLGLVDDSASGPADDLRLIGRVLVVKNTSQPAANSTRVVVSWDAEEYDTLNSWTSGTDLIAPAGATFVKASASVGLVGTPSGNGYLELRVVKNGVVPSGGVLTRTAVQTTLLSPRTSASSAFIPITPSDVITIDVFQTSGASMDIQGSTNVTWAVLEWYA